MICVKCIHGNVCANSDLTKKECNDFIDCITFHYAVRSLEGDKDLFIKELEKLKIEIVDKANRWEIGREDCYVLLRMFNERIEELKAVKNEAY